MSRKISGEGIKLIKNYEGCRLTAYKPVATEQYWTIGWGHYGPDVKQGATITQAEADAMLAEDLKKYEAYVNNPSYVPVTVQLNQNQFDALVSFCYNCGPGNLQTLCKGRTIAQIADSITKYDKAGGKVLAGLVRRRKAELELFNKKEASSALVSDKVNVDVNGKKVLDGIMINGLAYVPVRVIAESLGARVDWDGKSKTVKINK
jgi:GH24 family phage-related lysozyme (muramidase)